MNAHISQFHLSRFLAVFSLVQSIVPVDQGFYMNFTVPAPYTVQEVYEDVRGLLLLTRVGFRDVAVFGNTRIDAKRKYHIALRFDYCDVRPKYFGTMPPGRDSLYHGSDACSLRYAYGSRTLSEVLY